MSDCLEVPAVEQIANLWEWFWNQKAHIPESGDPGYPVGEGAVGDFFEHLAPLWNPLMAMDFVRVLTILAIIFMVLKIIDSMISMSQEAEAARDAEGDSGKPAASAETAKPEAKAEAAKPEAKAETAKPASESGEGA